MCSQLAAVAAAAVVVSGASAQAPPRVCEGLTICSPVAGPWVVVPAPVPPARLGDRRLAARLPRRLRRRSRRPRCEPLGAGAVPGPDGQPCQPRDHDPEGRPSSSQRRSGSPGHTSSFIPFIGCIPAEGGPRTPTGVGRVGEAGAARHRPDHPHRPDGRGPAAARARRAGLQAGAAPGRLDGLDRDLHRAPPDPAAARKVHLTTELIKEHVWITGDGATVARRSRSRCRSMSSAPGVPT